MGIPCLVTPVPEELSLSCSLQALQTPEGAVRSPQDLLLSRLNSPESLSLSPQRRGSNPLINMELIRVPWTCSSSHAGGTRSVLRIPGGVLGEQSRGGESITSSQGSTLQTKLGQFCTSNPSSFISDDTRSRLGFSEFSPSPKF